MYLDTAHNTPATAYGNVYRGLLVVALKFQAYVQEWGVDPRKKSAFLYSTCSASPGSGSRLTGVSRLAQTFCSRFWPFNGRRSSTSRARSRHRLFTRRWGSSGPGSHGAFRMADSDREGSDLEPFGDG